MLIASFCPGVGAARVGDDFILAAMVADRIEQATVVSADPVALELTASRAAAAPDQSDFALADHVRLKLSSLQGGKNVIWTHDVYSYAEPWDGKDVLGREVVVLTVGGYIIRYPTLGIRTVGRTAVEVEAAVAEARIIGERYLDVAYCPRSVRKALDRLSTRSYQRGIDALFKFERNAAFYSCVISYLDAQRPARIDSFVKPYPSWEAVYHQRYRTVGALLGTLLDVLADKSFDSSPDKDDPDSLLRLQLAWAYWAATVQGRASH
jgi:hypothetical protein